MDALRAVDPAPKTAWRSFGPALRRPEGAPVGFCRLYDKSWGVLGPRTPGPHFLATGPASRDGLGRPARRRLRLGGQAPLPRLGWDRSGVGFNIRQGSDSPLRPLHLSVRPAPTRRGSHCHASSFKAPPFVLAAVRGWARHPVRDGHSACATRRPRKARRSGRQPPGRQLSPPKTGLPRPAGWEAGG